LTFTVQPIKHQSGALPQRSVLRKTKPTGSMDVVLQFGLRQTDRPTKRQIERQAHGKLYDVYLVGGFNPSEKYESGWWFQPL